MTSATEILAHQGGWDEMLMVAGPIFLLWLILRAANRRAQRLLTEGPADRPDDAPDGRPIKSAE